jgi:hypothetical protein
MQVFNRFRIYRETLSRFSCAASRTALYIALPNIAETLTSFNDILNENIEKSPELKAWWEQEHRPRPASPVVAASIRHSPLPVRLAAILAMRSPSEPRSIRSARGREISCCSPICVTPPVCATSSRRSSPPLAPMPQRW